MLGIIPSTQCQHSTPDIHLSIVCNESS